mmetsp:Transcript_30651/g.45369  ORF Transcript_30651/g.45369 Transcript_30651/m.45369 type:complete len:425 (+) Transcript_30651:231-1505(+)|eukprot:CAMPEP_0195513444 /NCGR_PEP_ID=MMETSP0794_2-20130614/5087_1 /TAXON_ID=515487 /ORGANISM="Stephanopyxis turris, Strain CCMP 815" /LENGTH=424 /DNA_ID=CAMNT_0040641447 /DNA_START=177 /DNA_END=1451 /DNA_ORIENTATION=+
MDVVCFRSPQVISRAASFRTCLLLSALLFLCNHVGTVTAIGEEASGDMEEAKNESCHKTLGYAYKPSTFVSSYENLRKEIRNEIDDDNVDDTMIESQQSKTKLKVAAVQLHTSSGDHDASGSIEDSKQFLDRAVAAVETAVTKHGATLVLLQELFLGPYFCQSQNDRLFALAEDLSDLDDRTFPSATRSSNAVLAKMQKLAKRLNVVLPVSLFERYNNVYYNTIIMVDADGSILGRYRKSHIPDGTGYQEKFYFSPGDSGFKVFKTKVGNVGVAICWDQWFPEAARSMALMGADVLLYPTAIGTEPQDPSIDSSDHWQRTMQGHAAANMVPVVASNRVGTEILLNEDGSERQHITFYGRSFITDETGAIIKEAAPGDNGDIVVAEIDAERNRAIRSAWGLFRDRRPDLYGVFKTKDGHNEIYGV